MVPLADSKDFAGRRNRPSQCHDCFLAGRAGASLVEDMRMVIASSRLIYRHILHRGKRKARHDIFHGLAEVTGSEVGVCEPCPGRLRHAQSTERERKSNPVASLANTILLPDSWSSQEESIMRMRSVLAVRPKRVADGDILSPVVSRCESIACL